jgi:hypothetical protein
MSGVSAVDHAVIRSCLAKDNLIATEGGTVVGKNAPRGYEGRDIVVTTIEKRYGREDIHE